MIGCLDFALLDDLALARERKGSTVLSHLQQVAPGRLGPLIELCILDRMYPESPTGLTALREAPATAVVQTGINRHNVGAFYRDESQQLGTILTERNPHQADPVTWTQFCRKAQDAAEFAGLPKGLAQGLVGALRELETNIHEHSGRSQDGVIGFRATPEAFEFVVADSGIGVLAGLRTATRYRAMKDAGIALKTALTDGQSRLLDVDPNRGFGFHQLFVNLAHMNGELRFRSDDHALTIDGAGPTLPQARLSQKAKLQGFAISVLCAVTLPERLH